MFAKTALIVLVCAAAYAAGNPAAGVEWRWKPRHATVSPNIKGLPFDQLVETYVPKVRIPGMKTVEGCGPTAKASGESRIVGGNEATPHSYPWMAAVFIDDMYFCGGAIISEEWILTTASCMDGTQSVEIVLGAHNIELYEPSQVTVLSTDFIVHNLYDPNVFANNVALIKMSSPITWTSEIAPVCLPAYTAGLLPVGTVVNPSGWGRPSDSQASISDVLREVKVPVISNHDCESIYGSDVVTDGVICINSAGGRGTCDGDYGGPLNYVDGGVTYTRGISSFSASAGCESGYPDGFTRVVNYLDWIETNTGIAIDP